MSFSVIRLRRSAVRSAGLTFVLLGLSWGCEKPVEEEKPAHDRRETRPAAIDAKGPAATPLAPKVSNEPQANAAGKMPPTGDALVAQYGFDDAAGVADASPRGNHGQLTGGKQVEGVKGSALELDGTARSFFDLGTSPDFDFGPNWSFTVMGYMKPECQNATVLSFTNPPGSPGGLFRLKLDNGELEVHLRADGSKMIDVVKVGKIPQLRWFHLAVARTGRFSAIEDEHGTHRVQGLDVYVNGECRLHGVVTPGPMTTRVRLLGIDLTAANAAPGDASVFRGAFDDIRVYQRALSEVELKAFAIR